MGQTLVKNYLHIVFSTQNRIQLIDENIEEELFSYIGGICNNLKCQSIKVGGYRDHIHILNMLNKNMTLPDLMEGIKIHSSKWIKTKGKKYQYFFWQKGYGAFSVSPSSVENVIEYIANQKIHHQKFSFQTEYRQILKLHQIDFDERYVWD